MNSSFIQSLAPGRIFRASGIAEESVAGIVVALSGTILISAILLATYGNIAAVSIVIAGILLVGITCVRLDWSFYTFIGMVLAFDHHEIPGFQPFTLSIGFFKNLKENPFLPSFDIAVLNPLEAHLLLLIFMWFVLLGVKKKKPQLPVAWGTALLFIACLVGGFVFGLKTGGDFLPALWEVRALFYLGILYFFVPQIIQTKEQIQALFWVCIAALAFKALQGVARFAALGFSLGGFPTLTNHEDPVFFFTLIILLLGLFVFRAQHLQRTALLTLLPLLLMGFFVAQRRAAYGAAIITLVAFVVLLSSKEQWAFMRVVLPIATVLVLYCTVFWQSESKWGSPVRLIRSGLSNDKETSGERFHSNIYREFEKYDLAMTIRSAPITGIGFGRKYEQPIPLAEIPYPLREYDPHNEILWIMVKMGAIGFFAMYFFLDAFALRGASVFTRLGDPYLKAVCAVIVVAIVNQLVVSYYDLQLTYYRNMVYLGTLMGLLPSLQNLCAQAEGGSTEPAQVQ